MSGDEQLWQGYNLQGQPTKDPVTLPQAAVGALHGASHVWIWRKTERGIEVLLQERAIDKRTWPGFYDISAAGHIDYGETPLSAAVRETAEEIGLDVSVTELCLLFVGRQNFTSPDSLRTIENEFRWVYAYQLKHNAELTFTDQEVDEIWWVSIEILKRLVDEDYPGKKLVPQGSAYFVSLLDGLERFSV